MQLIRYLSDDRGTLGLLRIGSKYFYTLELPYKDNQKNISCIPNGLYKTELYVRPSSKQTVIHIKDVPNRGAILIHIGNTIADIQGCVLVGTSSTIDSKFMVGNSRVAFAELMSEYSKNINQDILIHSVSKD
jgi:hypothetical protein